MDYAEAKKKLGEYLKKNYTTLDQPWDAVFDKAYQALGDCLERGLTGED
jgi:hypothetical protein